MQRPLLLLQELCPEVSRLSKVSLLGENLSCFPHPWLCYSQITESPQNQPGDQALYIKAKSLSYTSLQTRSLRVSNELQ